MSEKHKLALPVVEYARENDEFRKVLWTDDKTRLELMVVPGGSEHATKAEADG